MGKNKTSLETLSSFQILSQPPKAHFTRLRIVGYAVVRPQRGRMFIINHLATNIRPRWGRTTVCIQFVNGKDV